MFYVLAQAVPGIDSTTVPGETSVPTWLLIAAIVILFAAREVERRAFFARLDALADASKTQTQTIERLLLDRRNP